MERDVRVHLSLPSLLFYDFPVFVEMLIAQQESDLGAKVRERARGKKKGQFSDSQTLDVRLIGSFPDGFARFVTHLLLIA